MLAIGWGLTHAFFPDDFLYQVSNNTSFALKSREGEKNCFQRICVGTKEPLSKENLDTAFKSTLLAVWLLFITEMSDHNQKNHTNCVQAAMGTLLVLVVVSCHMR